MSLDRILDLIVFAAQENGRFFVQTELTKAQCFLGLATKITLDSVDRCRFQSGLRHKGCGKCYSILSESRVDLETVETDARIAFIFILIPLKPLMTNKKPETFLTTIPHDEVSRIALWLSKRPYIADWAAGAGEEELEKCLMLNRGFKPVFKKMIKIDRIDFLDYTENYFHGVRFRDCLEDGARNRVVDSGWMSLSSLGILFEDFDDRDVNELCEQVVERGA